MNIMQRNLVNQLYFKMAKHGAVVRISLLQHFAYIYDFFLRTVFLILILFIFSQLWATTYEVNGTEMIDGYALTTLMWYLVITESIIMAMPAMVDRIENEVKNGGIAYFLNRPISYLGYHFGNYLGESLLRVCINLFIGGCLITAMYGGIQFSVEKMIGFAGLVFLAISLNYVTVMIVCLGAFWVEDIRGFHLVYNRLLMILGGMMIPLEIFPDWLEGFARALPFQTIVYFPATYIVGTQTKSWVQLILTQGLWLLSLTMIVMVIFRLGVKKLNVNGG